MRGTLLGSGLLFLASCSSSHGVAAEVGAWLDAMRDVGCERERRCEAQLGEAVRGACHPDVLRFFADAEELVRAGDLRFDREAAARCLSELDAPCTAEELIVAPACGDALAPTRGLGETCVAGLRQDGCELGLYCASVDARAGTCVPGAPPGASCLGRPCAEGHACMLDDFVRPVCGGPMPALGEPCTLGCSEGDCVDGRCVSLPVAGDGGRCGPGIAACEEGAICLVGVCRAPGSVPLGEPCAAALCAEGLYCDPTGRCAARRGPGEPCGDGYLCDREAPTCWRGVCSADEPPARARCRWLGGPIDAATACEDGHACVAEHGRCLPVAELGEPCDEWTATCAPGARCVDWACRAIAPPGEACGPDVVCPAAFQCRDGRCVPVPALGEACDNACLRGACVDGRCALRRPGEACRERSECGSYCSGGVCGPSVGEGDPCGSPSAVCDPGLRCAVDADGGTRCVR